MLMTRAIVPGMSDALLYSTEVKVCIQKYSVYIDTPMRFLLPEGGLQG